MFLYTSYEISLYVVSIFNTSANVESFKYLRVVLPLRFYLFNLSRSFLSDIGKGLFSTGTFICRTTNILSYLWYCVVHGTFSSFILYFIHLNEHLYSCSQDNVPIEIFFFRYLFWIETIIAYAFLFVNIFLYFIWVNLLFSFLCIFFWLFNLFVIIYAHFTTK